MRTIKLAFYSSMLNHHQVRIADELYKKLGQGFRFIEIDEIIDNKGSIDDYSKRPYLIRVVDSEENYKQAIKIATTAEVCVFSGICSLPYEQERLKHNLLSFDMDERPLKRGLINILSKTNLKTIVYYWLKRWYSKPLYKLCCSAFTKSDYSRLHMFKGKCYKWGYFTKVDEIFDLEALIENSTKEILPIMWCGRFLIWKHPEIPILIAAKMKAKGYKFQIAMYGGEGGAARWDKVYHSTKLQSMINKLDVADCVMLMGNRANEDILRAMRESAIFLFTSDRMEGWGAVANESMANACVLVASDEIGSTPYLINNGNNGFIAKSCNVDSFVEKVEWLLVHPQEMKKMQRNAYIEMRSLWSPKHAVESLLSLMENLKQGYDTSIIEGPCSKA